VTYPLGGFIWQNTGVRHSRPTIVIADDHELLREEVRRLLSADFDVLAVVEDGAELIEAARRFVPQVLVVDVSMPGLSGVEAVRRLSKADCTAAIVMLTVLEEPEVVAEAQEAGAFGFVSKKRMGQDLLRSIREALAGRRFVSDFGR
jgi:DNA-binding NarL/FixJ family response regulator